MTNTSYIVNIQKIAFTPNTAQNRRNGVLATNNIFYEKSYKVNTKNVKPF